MRGFFDTTKEYDKKWFIDQINLKFKGKYNFDKTNYVNIRHDVNITCLKHGNFTIRPFAIIRQNSYCPKCKNKI